MGATILHSRPALPDKKWEKRTEGFAVPRAAP
jgi:hypothetical protein